MNRTFLSVLLLLEDQDRRRDARAVKELLRQADHGIEQVFVDQLLPDLAFGRSAEQDAMRHDHAHAPGLGLQRFDHVQDEGVVALGLGRHAAAEAPELVRSRLSHAPISPG